MGILKILFIRKCFNLVGTKPNMDLEMEHLVSELLTALSTNSKDEVTDQGFSASYVKKLLQCKSWIDDGHTFRWNRWVPRK